MERWVLILFVPVIVMGMPRWLTDTVCGCYRLYSEMIAIWNRQVGDYSPFSFFFLCTHLEFRIRAEILMWKEMGVGVISSGEMARSWRHREWDAALLEKAQGNSFTLFFHLRWGSTILQSRKLTITKQQICSSDSLVSTTLRKDGFYH